MIELIDQPFPGAFPTSKQTYIYILGTFGRGRVIERMVLVTPPNNKTGPSGPKQSHLSKRTFISL